MVLFDRDEAWAVDQMTSPQRLVECWFLFADCWMLTYTLQHSTLANNHWNFGMYSFASSWRFQTNQQINLSMWIQKHSPLWSRFYFKSSAHKPPDDTCEVIIPSITTSQSAVMYLIKYEYVILFLLCILQDHPQFLAGQEGSLRNSSDRTQECSAPSQQHQKNGTTRDTVPCWCFPQC